MNSNPHILGLIITVTGIYICSVAGVKASETNTNTFVNWESVKEDLFLTFDDKRYPGLRFNVTVLISGAEVKAMREKPECQPAEKDPGGNWGEKAGGFQLSLRLNAPNTNESNVIATVLLRNVADRDLSFPLMRIASLRREGFFTDNFEFNVAGPDGKPIVGKPREYNPLSKHWQVNKRTQRKLEIRLSEEFDLHRPGKYRIQAKTLVSNPDGRGQIPIYSGEAVIEIGEAQALPK